MKPSSWQPKSSRGEVLASPCSAHWLQLVEQFQYLSMGEDASSVPHDALRGLNACDSPRSLIHDVVWLQHDLEQWLSRSIEEHGVQPRALIDAWFAQNWLFAAAPTGCRELTQAKLGVRWYWYHSAVPSVVCPWVERGVASVVSSRTGNVAAWHRGWFQSFDRAVKQIAREGHLWLLHSGIATSELGHHLADRLPVDSVRVDIASDNRASGHDRGHDHTDAHTCASWLERCATRSLSGSSHPSGSWLSVSPPWNGSLDLENARDVVRGRAEDALSILLPDVVHALFVRDRGNVFELIESRLKGSLLANNDVASDTKSVGTVRLYEASEQTSEHSRASEKNSTTHGKLASLGAVRWLHQVKQRGACDAKSHWQIRCMGVSFPLKHSSLVGSGSDQWLVHCTRGCAGPWPDESQQQYWDRWILENGPAEPSPLESLRRIVEKRRLVGRVGLVRGGERAVSLSEVPLLELLSRRKYRSHLKRWDWEPYGVCVRKDWCRLQGVRSVVYGSEAHWQAMQEKDRPFFQPDQERWLEEREWRCLGDLRLTEAPPECVIVFVPTRWEAEQLQRECMWPVGWLD